LPQETADVVPATGDHDIPSLEQPREVAGAGDGELSVDPHRDGERRRRRRGRRGGRRNRRGREGESFAPETTAEPEMDRSDFADEATGEAASAAPPAPEAEPSPIAHAEASRDVPPRTETAPQETQLAPIARPSHPETTAAESPPRRRSTVREPAQVLRDDQGSPSPSFTAPTPSIEPVVSSSAEAETSDRPRRSGWWSKRALGKS